MCVFVTAKWSVVISSYQRFVWNFLLFWLKMCFLLSQRLQSTVTLFVLDAVTFPQHIPEIGTTDMDNLKTHCQLSLARRDKTNQATAIRDKYSVFIESETIREDLLRTTTTSGYVLCRNANHCRIKRPKNTNKRLSVLCEATAGEVHLANTGHKICS